MSESYSSTCKKCGKEFEVQGGASGKFCSRACYEGNSGMKVRSGGGVTISIQTSDCKVAFAQFIENPQVETLAMVTRFKRPGQPWKYASTELLLEEAGIFLQEPDEEKHS